MKVLCINGSSHIKNGCVYRALEEMQKIFEKEGVEVEIVTIGSLSIRGCIACGSCHKTGKCIFDDEVNQIAKKFEEADGLVIASPVYYASANGTLISLLDRLFYSTHFDKRMKVGASVVSCRRGGNTATFDELNKYFTITQMPIVSSQYWNMVHGFSREDVEKDLEGLQTMRTLAKNMVFLMKSIELGKKEYGLPVTETPQFTSFME
ncbi:MAG: flavodoxin family protein [Roseburia sp.]|nr:flavodoxin family protein [Anaeroplasma bactoclasticum]MCM1197001.1 flavodoxin family protein [Roseburia sp.]MCM1556519.1 flavodoxin family protein [Anaeroplasma bactoclasticum]